MSYARYCKLPAPMTVTGRSSSITNAFVNAVVPVIVPTEAEEIQAISELGMDLTAICCAYCGDKATEWDHLNPLVRNQKPTGFITELANLVPACGKCNQSKGSKQWLAWINGSAKLSPRSRRIPDLERRIERLHAYEARHRPRQIDFSAIVGSEMWQQHWTNWQAVLGLMRESQGLATEIRAKVAEAVRASLDTP